MRNLILFSTLLACGSLFAQDKKTPEQIAAALNKTFEEAYAKGDVKGLLELFTDDAQFTSEEGDAAVGKEAISSVLSANFDGAPGGLKLEVETRAARLISPDVLVENGYTTATTADGETNTALFTAVYVQKDGKWRITELVESPVAAASPADHLAELDWLVGKWVETDEANGVTVTSEYGHARGGNFLTRNVTVKRGDDPALEGWQVIGWDPVQERIRSWTFDSEGGYSDGIWTRSGDRWLVREIGFAPDGSRNTSDITISKLSADKFSWESNNRTLDGEPQPSLAKIEISRAKGN